MCIRVTLRNVSFGFDHFDDFVHVFLADLIAFRFHHDADHRFGAAFPYQDAAGVSSGSFCASGLLFTFTFFSTCG